MCKKKKKKKVLLKSGEYVFVGGGKKLDHCEKQHGVTVDVSRRVPVCLVFLHPAEASVQDRARSPLRTRKR